jgi:predicted nuclease of predicted toxin-antitoxin system
MRLYLDDDLTSPRLAGLLRSAGHDVRLPADAGLAGKKDPVHLAEAVRDQRVCLTRNFDDFKALHELVMVAQGHHPGILVVRRDSNPKHNLSAHDIVQAIHNIEAANCYLADKYETLNHWR